MEHALVIYFARSRLRFVPGVFFAIGCVAEIVALPGMGPFHRRAINKSQLALKSASVTARSINMASP
jgi:hypothetical protein